MAVLKRSKESILGLNADLQALIIADSNEGQARKEADDKLTTDLNTEVETRTSEVTRVEGVVADNKKAAEDALTNATAAVNDKIKELTDNTAASDTTLQSNIDAEVEARKAADDELRKSIDNILSNTDTDALDSLSEIVDAFKDADSDLNKSLSDLAAARQTALDNAVADQDVINKAHDDKDVELDTKIDDSVKALNASIADEVAARTDAVATTLKKADNLADVADVKVARASLEVDSSAEVSEKVRLGGAKFITESLTVDSDQITLTKQAKNDTIFNFAVVRHVDDAGVVSDIPVTVDEAGSKVYNLHPDTSGQFDGKTVMVQYAYIPAS